MGVFDSLSLSLSLSVDQAVAKTKRIDQYFKKSGGSATKEPQTTSTVPLPTSAAPTVPTPAPPASVAVSPPPTQGPSVFSAASTGGPINVTSLSSSSFDQTQSQTIDLSSTVEVQKDQRNPFVVITSSSSKARLSAAAVSSSSSSSSSTSQKDQAIINDLKKQIEQLRSLKEQAELKVITLSLCLYMYSGNLTISLIHRYSVLKAN